MKSKKKELWPGDREKLYVVLSYVKAELERQRALKQLIEFGVTPIEIDLLIERLI